MAQKLQPESKPNTIPNTTPNTIIDSAQRSGAPFIDSAQRSGAPFIDTRSQIQQLPPDPSEWFGGRLAEVGEVAAQAGRPPLPVDLIAFGTADGVLLAELRASPTTPQDVLDLLARAMLRPQHGAPRRPTLLRVEEEELLPRLRELLGSDTRLRVSMVPELLDVAHALAPEAPPPTHAVPVAAAGPATYLSDGVTPAAMAGLFRAAAQLFRQAPWKLLDDEDDLLAIDIPELSIEAGCLAVLGRRGGSRGLVMCESVQDYLDLDQPGAYLDDPDGAAAPVLSLHYEKQADIPAEMQAEIAAHRFEVAGPEAYPLLSRLSPDQTLLPVGPREVRQAWISAAALWQLVQHDRAKVRGARIPEDPLERELRLEAVAGGPTVRLTLPHPELYEDDEDDDEDDDLDFGDDDEA